MEVADVRRRLRMAIEETRKRADERRARNDEASRVWERILPDVAVPAFHQVAQALNAEGYRFQVVTPGAAVRLVPERGGDEFVELALETDGDEPAVMIRSTRGRGRRTVTSERALTVRPAVDGLTDDAVVTELVEELKPFLQR
jgi:hypothetical protein